MKPARLFSHAGGSLSGLPPGALVAFSVDFRRVHPGLLPKSEPADLLRGIYGYLDGISVARCELTCKALRDAASKRMWTTILYTEFLKTASLRYVRCTAVIPVGCTGSSVHGP